jgi:hypothetical protein
MAMVDERCIFYSYLSSRRYCCQYILSAHPGGRVVYDLLQTVKLGDLTATMVDVLDLHDAYKSHEDDPFFVASSLVLASAGFWECPSSSPPCMSLQCEMDAVDNRLRQFVGL